jgi:hypothetical protein
LQSRWGARWCSIPVVAEIEWKCCLCVKRADKRGERKINVQSIPAEK